MLRSLLPYSFRWGAAFAGGLLIGLALLFATQIVFFGAIGYRADAPISNAPMYCLIAFFAIYIPATISEGILREFWFTPHRWEVSMVLGATQATLLMWWAFSAHPWIMLFVNPATLRWPIFRLLYQSPRR